MKQINDREMAVDFVLKQHNFVIFRDIFTKTGRKVYIFLFNSCAKFHAKIRTHQQKSRGILFVFTR